MKKAVITLIVLSALGFAAYSYIGSGPVTAEQKHRLFTSPPVICVDTETSTTIAVYDGRVHSIYEADNGVELHMTFDANGGDMWAKGSDKLSPVSAQELFEHSGNAIFRAFERGACKSWDDPDTTVMYPPRALR